MRTFDARYRGHCNTCDEPIEVGDQLRYEDDEVVHGTCKETVRALREVCSTCWLEKPCGCDD
jgi:hypothetical protein